MNKMRGEDTLNSWAQLDRSYDKFTERTSFTGTTAEGLYKKEKDAGTFQKVEPPAGSQTTRQRHQMKYDFMPESA